MPAALRAALAAALLVAQMPGALAQDAGGDGSPSPSLARTEQLAANLHQGMTLDEVQALLGKPQQTALDAGDGAMTSSSRGMLQWFYVWTGPSSHGRLRIDFTEQSVEAYRVSAWRWIAN